MRLGKEKFKIYTLTTYKVLLFMVIVITSILVSFIYVLFQLEIRAIPAIHLESRAPKKTFQFFLVRFFFLFSHHLMNRLLDARAHALIHGFARLNGSATWCIQILNNFRFLLSMIGAQFHTHISSVLCVRFSCSCHNTEWTLWNGSIQFWNVQTANYVTAREIEMFSAQIEWNCIFEKINPKW